MVVRTIGSHQGLSQRRPEIILKENLHFHPLIELHLSSRFCNTFFVTTFAVYLPKELLNPAAATRAAACAGKFALHTYFCNYTLSLSVFLFVLVFDLSILPVYIFSQELLDFVCVFVFVLACWSKNTFLQEHLFFVHDFVSVFVRASSSSSRFVQEHLVGINPRTLCQV